MNAQEFWNRKIVGWENARYSWRSYLNPGSWSVRSRLFTAADFLNESLISGQGLKIFELGCGSGKLLQQIKSTSNLQYEGWDISDVAIQKAKERFQQKSILFKSQDLESAEKFPAADVTVLLGVTDWISDASLKVLLLKVNSPRVLISYTEYKKSLRNHIYGLYRQWKDPHAFKATLYTHDEFHRVFQTCGWKLEKNLSTKTMSPGRLLWLAKNTLI